MQETLNNISLYEFFYDKSNVSNENTKDFDVNDLRDKILTEEENIKYKFREGEVNFSFDHHKKIIRLTNIFIYSKYRNLGIFTIIETIVSRYFDRLEIISVQTKRFAKHLFSSGYKPIFNGGCSFYKNINS